MDLRIQTQKNRTKCCHSSAGQLQQNNLNVRIN